MRLACASIREQLFRVGSEKLQVTADELGLGGGRVFVKADPSRGHALAEIVQSSIFRDRDGWQVMAFAHYEMLLGELRESVNLQFSRPLRRRL